MYTHMSCMYIILPFPPPALLAIGICFLGVYLQDNSEATTIQASEFPISVRLHCDGVYPSRRDFCANNPPSGYRT